MQKYNILKVIVFNILCHISVNNYETPSTKTKGTI